MLFLLSSPPRWVTHLESYPELCWTRQSSVLFCPPRRCGWKPVYNVCIFPLDKPGGGCLAQMTRTLSRPLATCLGIFPKCLHTILGRGRLSSQLSAENTGWQVSDTSGFCPTVLCEPLSQLVFLVLVWRTVYTRTCVFLSCLWWLILVASLTGSRII